MLKFNICVENDFQLASWFENTCSLAEDAEFKIFMVLPEKPTGLKITLCCLLLHCEAVLSSYLSVMKPVTCDVLVWGLSVVEMYVVCWVI